MGAFLWDVLPHIFAVWVFFGAVEIFSVWHAERHKRLRPMAHYVREWIVLAGGMTVALVAMRAHERGLIPLAALVLALLAVVLAGWWHHKKEKEEVS